MMESKGFFKDTLSFIMTLFAGIFFILPAYGTDLFAALSTNRVSITVNFTGTKVLLFGSIEDNGQVAVVVKGPKEKVAIRKKSRTSVGIWINRQTVDFINVPSYYYCAMTKGAPKLLNPRIRRQISFGLKSLRIESFPKKGRLLEKLFKKQLFRKKIEANLYTSKPDIIETPGHGRLFHVSIPFPDKTSTGNYEVNVHLIHPDARVESQTFFISIRKEGFEAKLYEFSHEHAFLYGLAAILIAICAGLLANYIFKRR